MKYSRHLDYLPVMLSWLHGPACRELAAGAQVLLPVPLHVKRLKERGFNQALLLAREGRVVSADGEEVPVAADSICVHGDTPDAVELAVSATSIKGYAEVKDRAVGRWRERVTEIRTRRATSTKAR